MHARDPSGQQLCDGLPVVLQLLVLAQRHLQGSASERGSPPADASGYGGGTSLYLSMALRAFFMSSSVSIRSAAYEGFAVRLYEKVAY